MDDPEAPPPLNQPPPRHEPRPEAQLGLPGDVESDAGGVRPGLAARPGRLLLAVGVLGLIGAGVWVMATQTALWASGYRSRRRAELRQQREAARAQARVGAPRYGTLRILGAPDAAAVYVALGHTPLSAPNLDTGQSHRVLLDLHGHRPRRVTVAPSLWKSATPDAGLAAPDKEVAELTAELQPGQAELTDDEDFTGTGAGSGTTGTLHLRSTPAGAAAWLLVGYTPVARIENLRLDRSYDLMVHKGGYLPGRATIPGAAFRDSPAGPEHEVRVELREPAAPRAKR
jgi:hypothetical protein